jgi:hypothetical protein
MDYTEWITLNGLRCMEHTLQVVMALGESSVKSKVATTKLQRHREEEEASRKTDVDKIAFGSGNGNQEEHAIGSGAFSVAGDHVELDNRKPLVLCQRCSKKNINQELWLPVLLPSLSSTLQIGLWDWDLLSANDCIGHFHQRFRCSDKNNLAHKATGMINAAADKIGMGGIASVMHRGSEAIGHAVDGMGNALGVSTAKLHSAVPACHFFDGNEWIPADDYKRR